MSMSIIWALSSAYFVLLLTDTVSCLFSFSQIDGELMLNFEKLTDLDLSNNNIQEVHIFVGE